MNLAGAIQRGQVNAAARKKATKDKAKKKNQAKAAARKPVKRGKDNRPVNPKKAGLKNQKYM